MSRNIMTISMPKSMAESIRSRVRSGEFASLSDYFRYAVREEQRMKRIAAARQRDIDEHRRKLLESTSPLKLERR